MDHTVLKNWAEELGFAQMGLCCPAVFSAQREIVDQGPALKERRQLCFDPELDCPWAKGILVLLWPYGPASVQNAPDQVFVDNYYLASNRAYQAAVDLEVRIQEAGFKAKANVSYPAKTAAVRAGLGVLGDNSLLITPEYGSRVVIILLATDAVTCDVQPVEQDASCLHCGNCAAACPAGALGGRGIIHTERCLRNTMLEGVIVPEKLRRAMGMKLVGCDICQRVCPMQPQAKVQTHDPKFSLDDFLTLDEREFKTQVAKLGSFIGKNLARPQRVRAQVALIAGNRKKASDLDILRIWCTSDFDAVREHAKWSFEEIECRIQGLDQCSEKR